MANEGFGRARRCGWVALAALALPATAQAEPPMVGPGGYYADWLERNERSEEGDAPQFNLINYFFTRGTMTNQLANPSGLRGVSLGPLGAQAGSLTRTGEKSDAAYIEQRWIPVLSYSPTFTDGLATFRAQFEVDFTWGIAANSNQQNQGGGFNSDQINLQTKNVNAAIYPTRAPEELGIVIGSQPMYDSVYDPAITSLFDITRTGYKLAFLGSDATALTAYGRLGGLWKASFIPFGGAQPDLATRRDSRFAHVYMLTADYSYAVQPETVLGLSLWRLQDDTKGAAYAFEGLVKSGPSSGGLSSFTGTQKLDIDAPSGGVNYFGFNFHHNINFRTGDFGASGFVMVNQGKFTNYNPKSKLEEEIDILGASANLELMYNYGYTQSDVITLEGMYTTGDENPADDLYTSAFTTNYYGLPGAVWFNHKTLLLFPFTSTVNNYTGSVTDISNQGYGLQAAILAGAKDLVPNVLNLKLGTAIARASVDPDAITTRDPMSSDEYSLDRGRNLGVEVNAELRYHIRYLMTVGLHGGYMFKGDFYEGDRSVADDPWAAYTTFTWYGF